MVTTNWSKLKDRPYPKQKIAEPIVKRYGKETSIYKEIQTYVDETDLYKCMEKYKTIDEGREEILEKIKNNPAGVFADVTNIQIDQEKLDIFAQQEKIKELWEQLPIEIRKEAKFNIENLPNVAKSYIEKAKAKAEAEAEAKAKAEAEAEKQINNMKGE